MNEKGKVRGGMEKRGGRGDGKGTEKERTKEWESREEDN